MCGSADEQLSRLCELNVLRQVFHVCTSPVVSSAWAEGQDVAVYGIIYSLTDGRIKKLAGPISADAGVLLEGQAWRRLIKLVLHSGCFRTHVHLQTLCCAWLPFDVFLLQYMLTRWPAALQHIHTRLQSQWYVRGTFLCFSLQHTRSTEDCPGMLNVDFTVRSHDPLRASLLSSALQTTLTGSKSSRGQGSRWIATLSPADCGCRMLMKARRRCPLMGNTPLSPCLSFPP